MKKITFCVLMILSSVFLGFSQVSIGVGTTIYTGLPIEPVNLYSYSQTIYRASDLNASGTITSLKWHFTGVDELENSQDVTVYLAHTTKNSFASDTDWLSLDDLTLVYTGGLEISESGWVTIPFTAGFAYNGTDNLVVAVKENHPGNDDNYDEFYNSVGPANTSIASWSWFEDINPNPANPPAGNRMPYYPNIIFEGITQACPTPFDVHAHAENIGTTTATIDWDAPVNIPSGGSQYFISTSPLQPNDNTEISGVIPSGNSLNLTNMSPGTTYYIWVRSVCENGVFSPWSTVYSFTSVCTATTEFFQSFDEVALPELPICWKKIVRGDNLNEFAAVETQEYGETQVIRMTNGNTQDPTDELLLIAPEIGNLTAGTHRLKFSAWDKGGNGASINVQVVTLSENTPEAAYTVYATINTESSFTGTDYIVDFSNYEGTDTFVGFKFDAAAWGSIVHLDNIRWEPIPPCPDVDATTIEVEELITTESTANILWGNDGGESWEVSYAEITQTNPDQGTIVPATVPAKELTQLTPNTDYNVWVRSICTEGNGLWIGPITFKTGCTAVDALNENFDASEVIPDCWSKLINGPTLGGPSIYVAGIEWVSNSDPNAISLGSGYSDTDGPDNIILVSPKLSNMGAGTHRFKFRAYSGGSSPDDIQVVVLESNKSTASMTVVGTFTSDANMTEHIVNFDDYAGIAETFIGIRLNTGGDLSGTVYIDDIVWEPMPPCSDTGTVNVTDISIDSAGLSWTPGGDETTWQVAYGPITATDPETETMFTTTTLDAENFIASANLEELLPATSYKVWVRSMCGDAGNGQWSVPVTFMTDCTTATAISENFESVTTPALPPCWSKILRGANLVSYAVVETTPVPAELAVSGTKVGSIYKGTSSVDDDMIMILPKLSNVNAGTHRLTFHANYRNFIGSLEIGTLNSNNPDAEFTSFVNIPLTTTMQYYEVDFADYQGTDTFIGFRINTASDHTAILIDDVVWEPTPTCAHILDVDVVDISDVGAEVSWITPGQETAWQVAYDVATVTSPDGITPVAVTENAATTLSGLEDGTQYNLWVRSVCGETFGSWYGPVTFKTDCTAVTSFSQNFDTTTTPALPECWKAIKRGATLAPMAVIETSNVGANSAPNVIVIYKGTNGENDDMIIVSPKISNAGAGTHRLTFNSMMQNGAGAELQIGTLDGYTSDAVFTLYESVSPTAAYQQFSIDFEGYNGTDEYIGIRLNSSAFHTVAYLDNIVWESTLSTAEFDNNAFNYYPNPVKDILNVAYDKNITKVAVYNVLGQEIMIKNNNTNQSQLDMSSLASGTYLVKVTAENADKTFKVIKQ